jgi:hypothetical protein
MFNHDLPLRTVGSGKTIWALEACMSRLIHRMIEMGLPGDISRPRLGSCPPLKCRAIHVLSTESFGCGTPFEKKERDGVFWVKGGKRKDRKKGIFLPILVS